MSNNQIEVIEHLDSCEKLEILWLNENKIQVLENLTSLKALKQLWVAGNKITKLGSALLQLKSLEDFNISGNLIGSFKEVLNLNQLDKISILALSDPHFGENPVCSLCNYQTFMIFEFPNIKQLDSLSITDESRTYADATFMKKQMYYNMRIKTIKRTASNIKIVLSGLVQKYQKFLFDDILPLEKELKMTEKEQGDKIKNDEPVLYQKLNKKIQALQKELKREYKNIQNVDNIRHMLHIKLDHMCKDNINKLMIELETGGNIRFEEGKTTDNWYTSCCDLVLSRYQGSPTLKVTKVTRIHNRFLRCRFEEKLDSLVDTSNSAYKRNLEYLFYGLDSSAPNELSRIMEEGFRTPEEYKDMNLPGCITLANSVQTAELARLRELGDQSEKIFQLSGQLLICKVYIGDSAEDIRMPIYKSRMTVSEA